MNSIPSLLMFTICAGFSVVNLTVREMGIDLCWPFLFHVPIAQHVVVAILLLIHV